jgi:hypothetical protein
MGSADARRKIVFAVSLVTLISAAAAMALLDRAEEGHKSSAASRAGRALVPAAKGRLEAEGSVVMREAAFSASRFVRAYLRYQAGTLEEAGRESLVRYSTVQLGGQLVRAPVRIPPGTRAPRQIVARIAAVQVSLFEGRPSLLVSVVIAGSNGTHLLRASVVKQNSRWVVAGIGP